MKKYFTLGLLCATFILGTTKVFAAGDTFCHNRGFISHYKVIEKGKQIPVNSLQEYP